MRAWRNSLAALVLIGVALAVPAEVRSAARLWDNGSADNDWFNGLNWAPDGPLHPSDELTVLTGTPRALSLVATDWGGSITIDGGGTGAALFDRLRLGDWRTGTLAITGGGVVGTYVEYLCAVIGLEPGSFIVDTGGTFTHASAILAVLGGTFDPGTANCTIHAPGNPTVHLPIGSPSLFGDLRVADIGIGTLEITAGVHAADQPSASLLPRDARIKPHPAPSRPRISITVTAPPPQRQVRFRGFRNGDVQAEYGEGSV